MNSLNNNIKIVSISGPVGSGKNSILEGVLNKCNNCARLVTATTREPREGELDGIDYHFITKEKFLKAAQSGDIPEYWHAQDTDRYYGTYLPDLKQKAQEGKIVLAQVQAEGVRYFKDNFNTISILVLAGSEQELVDRVIARHPMDDEELRERLDTIHKEMQEFEQVCDYTVYNKNGKLDEAIDAVLKIMQSRDYIN